MNACACYSQAWRGAPSRLVASLATYIHTLPRCVCVFHLVACLGSYIIISNSKAGSTLHLFLAGTALGGWPAYKGSILGAREGWAGTRHANCNWGCLSEPQPKSALCAGPKLRREGRLNGPGGTLTSREVRRREEKALPASLNWPWVFSLWGSSVPLLVISNAEGTAWRRDSDGENEASAVAVIWTVRADNLPCRKMTGRWWCAGSVEQLPPLPCAVLPIVVV